MPQHLHADTETFSEIDLRDVGAARYANDPSTEVLCMAVALDDEEPYVWKQGEEIPQKYREAFLNPEVLVYAHHAQFEMFIFLALAQKTWGIPCPDLSRFRCTMSFARRAALPAKLETLAEVLQLKNLKDNRGKALIKKFSMMQPAKKPTKKFPQGLPVRRILPSDEPEAFAEFCQYCSTDVKVEQEVARRLKYFDSSPNNKNYSLDAVINARGVPVNLKALRHAQKLIEEETEIVSSAFRKLVGFEVTQNARLLEWVNDHLFLEQQLPNLQAETVDTFLEQHEGGDEPCPQNAPFVAATMYLESIQDQVGCSATATSNPLSVVIAALRMKQSIAYAAIKKVKTMLLCAGPHDNRIRGMLNFHGATTGRWSHSLVQLGNMKRPTIKHSGVAYRDICDEMSLEMLRACHGEPLEVISSCVRHFVHDCENGERPWNDVDYSSIESRIVCWLADQEDALEEYRQGIDRYKRMASFIYSVPESNVNKFPQRFVGKTAILLLGFQGGSPKFREACMKTGGYDLPTGMEFKAVDAFRLKHHKVVKAWYAAEDAARNAIVKKGTMFHAAKCDFLVKDVEGMPFLLIRLPSGRKLAYPKPRVENRRIVFFGNIKGTTWGTVDTYGGKIIQNITEGVQTDLMINGLHNAEAKGYETATVIHDQALAFYREGQTVEEFVECLTRLPAWAKGFPLAAEGSLTPFYVKE